MRTRVLVAVLAISFAVNLFLAAALVSGRRTAAATEPTATTCDSLCGEERSLREELSAALCTRPTDREKITAVLARLDSLRGRKRDAALDQWFAACERVDPRARDDMHRNVMRTLCPWSKESGSRCAPSPPTAAHPDQPAQPRS